MAHATGKADPETALRPVPPTRRFGGGRPTPASARLYSPGGCGCALLMAPAMAAAMGLAALSLGMAALAVGGLAIAVALTVREVRRARDGAGVRTGFAVAAAALYLASVPYLVFFIWLWFVD